MRPIQIIVFCLCMCSLNLYAQVSVTGTVNDNTGESLPGVSILAKDGDRTFGTTTDINGRYEIKVNQGATLEFSFIGFAKQKVKVGTNNVINITLEPENEMLDEVVVIGYGSVKKKDLLGSISTVKEDALAERVSGNVVEAMRGLTSGVKITSSGQPGSSATINIPISHFMHLSQQEGDIPHTYGGRTYYFNEGYMKSSFDAVLEQTSKRGISVAGILLVPPTGDAGTLLKHPDFNGIAPYTMPNMTTIESTNCYAAALDFLAERYSDPNMRIAHWIIHNEVDGGSHWTNMGDKPIATFMDTYLRSMRMCYNIAHQYDQHSEVFISFSHGWNIAAGGGWYKVRDMLDFMNQFSESEGDFFWSLACHSYPAQLGNPCTWDDEQATYSMDTEYVTLKNLEVLDKWVKTSRNQYKGTIRRSVWLSEAGTCSPSYEDDDLQDQAAGFAYGWKKINNLDGINGIQWHSWFDHLGDGACLGLRKYADAPHNGEAKPVWTTYQKADTDEEDDYFEQYLSRIGIDSWEGIIQDIP